MSSHYRSSDRNNDITVGSYYEVGGVNCIVLDILNDLECKILDLFEDRERTAYRKRLTKIEDEEQLTRAKLAYRKYLDKKQTDLSSDNESDHNDNNNPSLILKNNTSTTETASHLNTFILKTDIGKVPEDNKYYHVSADCCHVPCESIPSLCIVLALIIGILFMVIGKLYFIGSVIIGGSIIVICCAYFIFYRGCQCRKHENKMIFDENKQIIYWYWNNALHSKIPYNKFSRVGWHRYVLHGSRTDNYYANVYIVRYDQKPIRFNWYLAKRSDADKFTNKVNNFWAEKQNIVGINNLMSDQFTNFNKDVVVRHNTNFDVRSIETTHTFLRHNKFKEKTIKINKGLFLYAETSDEFRGDLV